MKIKVGDIIETMVGGPYKVREIKDNLVIFDMKNGMGQTITQHVTKIVEVKKKKKK